MDNSQGALLNDINIYVTLIYIYHEIKVNFKIPRLFPLCYESMNHSWGGSLIWASYECLPETMRINP